MRTGFDPTTLTWVDVDAHFMPKRLKSDPGAAVLRFSTTLLRVLKITNARGKEWMFRVQDVALETNDHTSRECRVKCTMAPDDRGVDDADVDVHDELSLTAALLAIAFFNTPAHIPRDERSYPQYKNAHWDDAAMAPPDPLPVLLPIPPMPDHHPQLLPS